MDHHNYASKKSELLKKYDKTMGRVKKALTARYGREQVNTLIQESRQEYEVLIPMIPYIGDKNPFLIFLLPASRYLAVYRVFQKQGRPVAEAGRMVYAMGEAELKAIPGCVRYVIGYLWFSPWFIRRLQKRVAESQVRKYPGGWVLTYVARNGEEFDYGIDYTECAICKFLRTQDAVELVPYVCAVDRVASEMLGWGLKRTMTLAEGGEKCDFRFKKGGKTCVAIPQSVKCMDILNTA